MLLRRRRPFGRHGPYSVSDESAVLRALRRPWRSPSAHDAPTLCLARRLLIAGIDLTDVRRARYVQAVGVVLLVVEVVDVGVGDGRGIGDGRVGQVVVEL